MTKPPRSLKSRALQLLAQREQSRVELRRKLMLQASAEDAARLDAAPNANVDPDFGVDFGVDPERAVRTVPEKQPPDGAAARVDAVLTWLETNRFVSDQRFAESRVHVRAPRFGNLRIRQELKQHGVTLTQDTARLLHDTEWSRALGVWERRFGQAPQTAAETAKQLRFLTARGFSPDIVRRVLRGQGTGTNTGVEAGAGAEAGPDTTDTSFLED